MSGDTSRPRPQQVTTAGWVVVIGAVLLMASAFDTMTGLHSLDTRAMLSRSLGTSSFGLSLDQATGAMHAAVLISGGAAAAAAVLGIYVLRGDRVARAALGAVAVIVALSSPFSGMFFGTLVAVGAALLWSRPARDWFAGRPAAEAPRPSDAPRPAPLRQDAEQPDAHPVPPQQPPPHTGYGQTTPGYPSYPSGQPVAQPGYGEQPSYGAPWAAARVPGQIRTSTLITWVLSGIVILLYGFIILAMLIQPDDVVNGFLKQADRSGRNFTAGEVKGLVWSVCIVFELWAISACVLARLVRQRRNWARVTLIISAVVSLLVAVISTLSFPLAGLYIVGCGIAIGQLASRSSRAWTGVTPTTPGGPPPPGPQPPQQQTQQPQPPAQRPPSDGDQGGQPPVW